MMAEEIKSLLLRLGISPTVKGFRAVAYALELILQKPTLLDNIHHRLYPAIAKKFETTPSRVERTIRYAIQCMFDRRGFDGVIDILILEPRINSCKYTNSEFLAICAMKLKPEVF